MIAILDHPAPDYAANLRRLMAREGLTLAELARRSRLNCRTLKGVLKGSRRPRARTLHQLAASLNVPVEELFQDPALLRHRLFDRQTNPVVEELVQSSPRLFHGWSQAEFDEIYSRFGTGGALTPQGALETVCSMNRRRELIAKVKLLWETGEAELLESMIDVLYRRVIVTTPDRQAPEDLSGSAEDGNFVSDVAGAIVCNTQLVGRAGGDGPA
jgi:transcriptional regulator with XRE-family HTH domain